MVAQYHAAAGGADLGQNGCELTLGGGLERKRGHRFLRGVRGGPGGMR